MRLRLLLPLVLMALGVGGVVWVAGQFAIGRASEDACAARAEEEGYQSWSSDIDLVPPAHRCRLDQPERLDRPPSVTVDEPVLAFARFGVTVLLPVVWLLATISVVVVLLRTRRPTPR